MPPFTRNAIKQSFWKLLSVKPLSKITVRDIVDDCGINRNSFYYHFDDIPTLLNEIMKDEGERIISNHTQDSVEECLNEICKRLLENKKAILNIYNSLGREVLVHSLMKTCEFLTEWYLMELKEETDENTRRAVIHFAKCFFFGMAIDWMNTGMSESIFSYNHQMCRILECGVREFLASYSEKEG
ncbi:MAG: TetR/AcrR family transcriptional regulator [Eubacteriales bacterium]|nr:TetR/AcrR family transcriptional regulator [Eubacteriales bacterium]